MATKDIEKRKGNSKNSFKTPKVVVVLPDKWDYNKKIIAEILAEHVYEKIKDKKIQKA